MTRQDFILSIVSSIIATISLEFARKGLVYLRSKKFRKARRRFLRTAPAQISNVLAPVFPAVIRHPLTIPAVSALLMVAIPMTLALALGDSGPHSVDPFGNPILPFDLLGLGL